MPGGPSSAPSYRLGRGTAAVLFGVGLGSGVRAQVPEEPPAPVVDGWFELRPAAPDGKTPFAVHEWAAGWAFVLGAAAGLTRISSLALALFALDELLERRWKLFAVALTAPFAGLALFMAWLWRTTGDPLRFLNAQESFGRDYFFDAGRLFDLLARDATGSGLQSKWDLFFLFLVLVGAATLVLKGRWGEAGYSAAAVLMPLALVRIAGVNRYAFAAFPAFILLGGLQRGKVTFRVVLGLEILLLFFYAARFGLQHWVG